MPKPITMTIDVEEIAFGKVWRTIDAMPGVVAIRLQGSGPKVPVAKQKVNGAGGKETIPDIILTALKKEGARMNKQELADVISSAGKKASSLPDGVAKLKKLKLISSSKRGEYQLTTAGRKAANIGE